MGVERPRLEVPADRTAPAAASRPPEPTPPGWYGAGAVVADVAAAGMVVTAGVTQKYLLVLPGYLTYLLGGPLNHAAHGRSSSAAVSLGLRAIPLAAAALLASPALRELEGLEGNDGSCGPACTLFVGAAFVAPVVIAAIDDIHLSTVPDPAGSAPKADPAPRDPGQTWLSWSPVVSPRREGGWTLGAVGRF